MRVVPSDLVGSCESDLDFAGQVTSQFLSAPPLDSNRPQAVETHPYVLHRLIAIDRACDRYEGTLADGRPCEVCLLHTDVLLERIARHLRLIELAGAPAVRAVVLADLAHASPWIALEPIGQPATQVLEQNASASCVAQPRLPESASLASLIHTLVSTIHSCHQVGLVIGDLNAAALSWTSDRAWKIDLTTLGSDRFLRRDDEPTLDSSDDIYALGKLVYALAARGSQADDRMQSHWQALFADCLAADPLDRPTISQLAARLSQSSLEGGASPLASRPASDSRAAATGAAVAGGGSSQNCDATFDFETVDVATASSQCPTQAHTEPGARGATEALNQTLASSSSRPQPVTLTAGSRIGRYTIDGRLGVGGMGAVYRAHDEVDNSPVAIKVLNRQVAPDSVAAARFAKEARMLAKANNPYIACLFEVNSEGDVPFMAFEYIEGGSLGGLLKAGKPMDEKLALAILCDAVRGLAIAHKRNIVHRDFKPDNVLLTRAARDWLKTAVPQRGDGPPPPAPPLGKIYAKVSDFGLARTLQQSESLAMTRDGTVLGTPMYMSPEQCKGQPAGYAADVYSVGVTLFQMLAGKPPFESDTHVALMNKHCHEPPPSLKQLRPQLPEALVAVIEKCLAKNAEARYPDAGELLSDLENLLRGMPTSLRLHPPILSLQDESVLRFEHSWQLRSSPAELWPYIANTDRINHAIGLPAVQYTSREDPVHGKQRFAEATFACQKIRWQEHPYEWIEGKRLSVLREFTDGPFRWFVNIVDVQPDLDGGARVLQSLIVAPRNWLGQKLARLQLGKRSRDNFGRVYHHIDDYLQQMLPRSAHQDPFVGRTELTPAGRRKLQLRLDHLREQRIDPTVVNTLGQFLEHASDLEVARIRPLEFAERFHLDPTEAVNAFLIGSRCGLFTLLWDILCPSCRIPASTQETLAALKDHGYCEACDIQYALDLSQSVELIFRVHPELRGVETQTYCIGGPAWSRHVVAQVRLAPGERFACELDLSAGSYVVRGPRMAFTVNLQIGHTSKLSRFEVSLARPPQLQTPLPLQVGSQVILLNNDSGQDQQVRIERTASRHDALSAAQASTIAAFRELFPEQVLSADQIVSIMVITLMQVKIDAAQELYRSLGDARAFHQIRGQLDQILRLIQDSGGAVVKTIGEGVLASFASPPRAVAAALELQRRSRTEPTSLPLSIAIHSGPAMAATLDDRLDYFGMTLQSLTEMIDLAPPQAILASDTVTQADDVRSVLNDAGANIQLFADPNVDRDRDLSGIIVHRLEVP